MDRPEPNSTVRRYLAYVSPFGTTQLHLRSPLVIAFWSLAFPGLGHLLLSKYLRGYLLFIWELFVNSHAHVNLGILYSFTGRFQMAKEVLDINWVLLYIPTYIFAVWDAYRTTVDLNHQYILATREDAEVKVFNINPIEINYLDKRTPWNAAVWSTLMPGLGQVLIHRVPAALFIIISFMMIAHEAKILPAFHYTFMGQFDYAKAMLLLLRRLTLPIRTMQKATHKIAGGVYDERIYIPGKDEFHELAENFNQMTSSIQEKINELDKNAQDKQRLIDNLAHELRTPLTAIRGYAEYLQSAKTTEPNRIKAADYIISEIDRMKNLAFKLLDLALVRNSKLDLQELIPRELLNQVKVASESKLKEKNQTLTIDSTLNKLRGDSILLQSLVLNLIDNAAKASAENSTLSLLAYFDYFPVLEVRDSGCGMEAEQAALVCEPFYRVDQARSRSSGGVGLGLSLCREIAQLHGGELRISSYPGKGTTVQIVFTTSLQLAENSLMHKDV